MSRWPATSSFLGMHLYYADKKSQQKKAGTPEEKIPAQEEGAGKAGFDKKKNFLARATPDEVASRGAARFGACNGYATAPASA